MKTFKIILILTIGGIVFFTLNTIFALLRKLSNGLITFEQLNRSASENIFNLQGFSTNLADIGLAVVPALLLMLFLAVKFFDNRRRRPGVEHGSARFAKPKELQKYADLTNKKNNHLFAIGAILNLDARKHHRNLNVLVIGGSGSGKSRFYVSPNLYQANTSFVVTDPKGELYRAFKKYLTLEGYSVRCLNLIDFASSAKYNPLAYFNPEQPEVDCMILTENIISNTNGSKPSSGDSFWEKAEKALLNALVTYTYFTSWNEDEEITSLDEEGKSYTRINPANPATLIKVVDLLSQMQAFEKDDESQSYVDIIFETVKDWIDIYDNALDKDQWGKEAIETINGLRFAYSQYRTYSQGAGETKKSVIISLGVRLAPLHMSQIRELLSADEVGLNTIGMDKTALFLIIPDTHATFSFLISILYEQMFEKNLYIADHQENGRLPVMIQCFMDEFANIGKMPSFERKIAVMRSRGISTSVIVQNYSQGKALYKDDWETIVGNCDSTLFLGGNETKTTETISKMLGKETIISNDTSVSKGRTGSSSISERSIGRELLTPSEIGEIPSTNCIYFLRGERPYMGKKLPAPPIMN
ncbi:MAG: type IV secretory system conjugative DNA transfer family protein [Arcanobacterium sp.]|nr:type IV secretory system conjugative DNA transfer family protein [Arcanobacterium sp.]